MRKSSIRNTQNPRQNMALELNQKMMMRMNQEMIRGMTDRERIERDLWSHHRRRLASLALAAKDGEHISLSDGEAETLARQETEREIAQRLKFYETTDASQVRPKICPKAKPQINYVEIDL